MVVAEFVALDCVVLISYDCIVMWEMCLWPVIVMVEWLV